MQKEQLELQKQIQQIEVSVKPFLSKEAVSRYSNLKAAHPEKAIQSLLMVFQLIQSGKLVGVVSDEDFKELLMQFNKPKKEFKVVRK